MTFSSFKGLPTQVLVGTDLVEIASFNNSMQPLGKHYMAEMGGAILTIEVTQSNNIVSFIRTYQEPGRPEKVHEYSPVCLAEERLSADKLKGKLVKGGVLILEEQSGLGGIPAIMWVFYKKETTSFSSSYSLFMA